MTRRTTPVAPPKSAFLTLDELKLGIARLKRRIEQVEEFDPQTVTRENQSALVAPLRASIEDALGQTFGHGTVEYQRYEPAARFDHALLYTFENTPLRATIEHLRKLREKSLALLRQAVASLEERLSEVGVT